MALTCQHVDHSIYSCIIQIHTKLNLCYSLLVVGTYDFAKERKKEKEAKADKLKELEEARKKKKSECL